MLSMIFLLTSELFPPLHRKANDWIMISNLMQITCRMFSCVFDVVTLSRPQTGQIFIAFPRSSVSWNNYELPFCGWSLSRNFVIKRLSYLVDRSLTFYFHRHVTAIFNSLFDFHITIAGNRRLNNNIIKFSSLLRNLNTDYLNHSNARASHNYPCIFNNNHHSRSVFGGS